ncbi:MAG: hemerythrin domain-containing protein [Frankia sp.]|nr:hemerythrin domain-containing protein [Frankia sp.]
MSQLLTAQDPRPDETARDEAARRAVVDHHAALVAGVTERAEAMVALVDTDYPIRAEQARRDLVAYLRREVLPHAQAEELALYPPAAALAEGHLLVAGLVEDHRALAALVDELASTRSLVRAAAVARALAVLFVTHVARENDLVLPLLARGARVSLADALATMHGLVSGRTEPDAPPDAPPWPDDHRLA